MRGRIAVEIAQAVVERGRGKLALDVQVDRAVLQRLEIRWPNGLEEMWTDIGIDRIVTLREGSGAAVPPGK